MSVAVAVMLAVLEAEELAVSELDEEGEDVSETTVCELDGVAVIDTGVCVLEPVLEDLAVCVPV